jgi:sensor histidine kinase YesM
MIKDQLMRIIFIPLLGVIIPFFSGVITYQLYSNLELVASFIYFILMSFCIWTSAAWLHHKTRYLFTVKQNPFIKIGSISLINALFGAATTGIFSLIWFRISKENFTWDSMLKCICFSALAVIVFTLVYEILFLSKERELDTKIVDQLDWERSKAEMSLLKNELEPHFIFNSLNALSYLILSDPETAHEFNSKLASVYKYFLINKDRDLITLQNELEFIGNYFFLLQVRHDNKLHLATELNKTEEGSLMILPYALQVAVENAIKHNEFTDVNPLYIRVITNGEYILVKNNKLPKSYSANSTGIGLRNLSSRYKMVCNKDILIETNDYEYTIKLPIIKSNA